MCGEMFMFEVIIQISSTMEQIISPCNLARAIGVPPGAKLRLRRDTARRAEQSRMVVRCDRPTASLLRRRFSKPRPYTHEGQLTSLLVVGMKPVVDRGDDGGAFLRPAEGGAESPRRLMGVAIAPPSSGSPIAGVEVALEVIERAETDGLHVPGVAELYEEFLEGRASAVGRGKGAGTRIRRSRGSYNEEEKKSEHEEQKESQESTTSSDEANQEDSSSSDGSSSPAENRRWHKLANRRRQHRRPPGRHKYWRDRSTGEEERRKST